MLKRYPSLSWLKGTLRNNLICHFKRKILAVYIIGSEAKGTSKVDSDIDIAVIIEPIRGKTSLKLTEQYHQKFKNDDFKPRWEKRLIDIQFFYPDNPELAQYKKIELF